MAEAIADMLNAPTLKAGTVLRVGLEVRGDEAKIVRISVYDRTKHTLTVALDDRSSMCRRTSRSPTPNCRPPSMNSPPVAARGNLPSIYDGIYRAAFSYGMSRDRRSKLIKLLARMSTSSRGYAVGPLGRALLAAGRTTTRCRTNSELLFVSATFGGNDAQFLSLPDARTARSTISTRTAAATASSCCAIRCRTANSAPASADAAIRSSAM